MTIEFTDVERVAAKPLLTVSLREDLARDGDITTQAFLAPDAHGTVKIVSRQTGVVAGLPLAESVWRLLDATVEVKRLIEDGNPAGRRTSGPEFHDAPQRHCVTHSEIRCGRRGNARGDL
jgi:hypothetical protein